MYIYGWHLTTSRWRQQTNYICFWPPSMFQTSNFSIHLVYCICSVEVISTNDLVQIVSKHSGHLYQNSYTQHTCAVKGYTLNWKDNWIRSERISRGYSEFLHSSTSGKMLRDAAPQSEMLIRLCFSKLFNLWVIQKI